MALPLPEIAIGISLASLVVAATGLFLTVRNNRFNKRMKLIEKKAEMLAILSDLALNHSRNIAIHKTVGEIANRTGKEEIRKLSGELGELLDKMAQKIDGAYRRAFDLRDSDMEQGVESLLPEVKRIRDRSTGLFETLDGLVKKHSPSSSKV